MTPKGVKPWKKKVTAVLRMSAPTNQTQVRSFLGAVTYYESMWHRRSHFLAPLMELTGRGPFVWTQQQQNSFDEMKEIMVADALLDYLDANQPFEIYTNTLDYQMGAAIIQNGRIVAY